MPEKRLSTSAKGKGPASDTQQQPAGTGRVRQPSVKQQQINSKAATAQANKAARVAEVARVLAEQNRDPEERYSDRLTARDAHINIETQPTTQRRGAKKINAAPPPGFRVSSSTRPDPPPTSNSASGSQLPTRPPTTSDPAPRPTKHKSNPQRISDSDDENVPPPPRPNPARPKPSDYDFDERGDDDENHAHWLGRNLGFDEGGDDADCNGNEDLRGPRDDDRAYDEDLGEEERREMEEDPNADEDPNAPSQSQSKQQGKRPAVDSPPASPRPIRRPRNSGGQTTRPKAGNYEYDVRSVLDTANRLFRIKLATTMGFPTTEAAIKAAYQMWKTACIGTECEDLQNSPDIDQITIILSRECQLRGELKTIARPLVRAYYQFLRRDSKIADNVTLYQNLIHRATFVFENVIERKRMWCHAVLFDIIWEMWFAKKTRDGVRYADDFGRIITPETIALVFTVVRNCIDEWESGTWEQVDFTADDYTEIYESLLADLKLMGEPILQAFGRQLWKDASKGKVFSEASAPISSITSEEKERAIRELQEWTEAHQD